MRLSPPIHSLGDICHGSVPLYEGLADTEDVDKLFWGLFCTHRPETASYAACHDDKVIVHIKKRVYGNDLSCRGMIPLWGVGALFPSRLLCGIMFGVLGCVIESVQAIVSSDLGCVIRGRRQNPSGGCGWLLSMGVVSVEIEWQPSLASVSGVSCCLA